MKEPFIGMITGAGWKCGRVAGSAPFKVSPRCPELLMSIGSGQTVLSRLASQFKSLGATDVYAGVGCPDTYRADEYAAQTFRASGHKAPGKGGVWTWDAIQGVRDMGVKVVLANNPLYFGSRFHTVHLMLSSFAGYGPLVDRFVIVAGDYVYRTDFLETLIEDAVWPSITWLMPKHEMMFLNKGGRQRWIEWARVWIKRTDSRFLGRQSMWKDKDVLAKAGIPYTLYSDAERRRIAPYIGRTELLPGSNPLFAEIGPDRGSWTAAVKIAATDKEYLT